MEKAIPLIPSKAIQEQRLSLDIDEWEFRRTHWAVKDIDLFSVLLEAGLITKVQLNRMNHSLPVVSTNGQIQRMVISPEVFKVPSQQREPNLVSVMMPFDSAFASVYKSIEQACKNVGLRCLRADDIWEDSTIIQDVFNLLYRGCIVVADFTGRNSNVMYETGIAHTLGRPVVPISQSKDDIPFDLRHHRFLFLVYLPNKEGLSQMRTALEERLKTILNSSLNEHRTLTHHN